MLVGKAVVCTCGEIGIVTHIPAYDDKPFTITHLHDRTHQVFDYWAPDQLVTNKDGYYVGDR